VIHVIQLKLSNKYSIYCSAEALISYTRSSQIFHSIRVQQSCIILTDSLSAVTSLKNIVNPSDIARNIQNFCHIARSAGQHISFIWIPRHSNIAGNEKADEVAKLSHSSPKVIAIVLYQDSLIPLYTS